MPPSEPSPSAERNELAQLIAKFDSYDTVTERAAISVMKLAGWVATLAVMLYGLLKSL
jgi:hypothetical protein